MLKYKILVLWHYTVNHHPHNIKSTQHFLTYACLRCCTMFAQTFIQLIYSWSGSAFNSKHSWFQIYMSVDVHLNKYMKCVVPRHHFFFLFTQYFLLKDVVSVCKTCLSITAFILTVKIGRRQSVKKL